MPTFINVNPKKLPSQLKDFLSPESAAKVANLPPGEFTDYYTIDFYGPQPWKESGPEAEAFRANRLICETQELEVVLANGIKAIILAMPMITRG